MLNPAVVTAAETLAAAVMGDPDMLAAVYRDAARQALTSSPDPLAALLPLQVMPSEAQLAIVYAVTGTSEADRLDGRVGFRKTAATEAAWSRAMLKRWAAREQMVERAR